MLAAAPAPALAASSATSRLTAKPPSRLARTQHGNLPMTGTDLLPETLVGLALLGAGVGLRARRKC